MKFINMAIAFRCFFQDCFGESTEFYGFTTLVSRNETCFMNETCELEGFLESSDIEPEDESAEDEPEDQFMNNINSAEQDDNVQARNTIGMQKIL